MSFRLELDGDFSDLLRATVDEYAARGGLQVELDSRLDDGMLNPNQEVHVLQIVREALANVLRHAAASRVRVSLGGTAAGDVVVGIEDDGIGLGSAAADTRHHHGMAIMRERARGLGGRLDVGARAGGGTRVMLQFRLGQGGHVRNGMEVEQ